MPPVGSGDEEAGERNLLLLVQFDGTGFKGWQRRIRRTPMPVPRIIPNLLIASKVYW